MAFDPNDAEVIAHVEEKVTEATTRLKAKNEELIGEIRTLRQGKGDPDKLEKLEKKLEETQQALDTAIAAEKKATKDLTKVTTERDGHAKRADSLLVSNAVAKAVAENKIAPQFADAVDAMFASKATVKVEGEAQTVMVGDVSLGDAIKAFVASDNGKHYVAAANNGGGGAGGGGANTGAKTVTRSAFDAMPPQERMDFSKGGGVVTDT